MKIVCVGDCGIDHYRDGERRPGGITLNFARHARSCLPDADIGIVTAVGTDEAATAVRRAMEDARIDADLTVLEGRTPVQHIDLAPDGERRFVGYEVGVLAAFRPSGSQCERIAAADWVVVPHFEQVAGLFAALLALPRRGRLAVDFADFGGQPDFALLQSALPGIDVAFFGLGVEDEETLAGIRRLAEAANRLLVVTLGASGSRAHSGGITFRQEAVAIEAVADTTGAGDAFAAGFLSRHCHGAPVAESLEAGARRAAIAIQHRGGH